MERVTKDLEPERLWYYFEEISKLPRASRNERKVREFIIQFAKENDLVCMSDDAGNVLVVKAPSKGFEDNPTLVLQAHMDMVCEKNEGVKHDFSKDPIKLVIDGEWMRAKGTTLGADNGIGVAAILAVLEDRSIRSGKLEALFTAEEEIGLIGAMKMKEDLLEGRYLINLDAEETGTVYIGCAGGRDSHITLPLVSEKPEGSIAGLKIKVGGCRGGHSGVNIHEGRANAIKLLARILKIIAKKEVPYRIAMLIGGDKMNAIPREASCTVVVEDGMMSQVKGIVNGYTSLLRDEFQSIDPEINFCVEHISVPDVVYDSISTEKIVNLLMALPHGVLAMSGVMDGLVETSTNVASVRTEEKKCRIGTSQRSSKDSALEWVSDMHVAISQLSDAHIEQDEGYPGWNPDPNSKLLQYVKSAVKKVMGKDPIVKAVHAGIECGVIKTRYKDMDAISVGPTVEGVHSPDERVNIKSVETSWKILLQIINEVYRG
ncbi:MAG: aminoacyl-histidine dipeptidase [Spirochaetota bacterium]|nr:MAG: aminoacyl-histidine dipeptidase [Spirochaetota bacterium]